MPLTRTVRLSSRLTVVMTLGNKRLDCVWHPDVPSKMSAKETRRYKRARDDAIVEMMRLAGIECAGVLEI